METWAAQLLAGSKQSIEELVSPLDEVLSEGCEHPFGRARNGLDLIMGELIMVTMLLTSVDHKVADQELAFLNEMRQIAYGPEVTLFASRDYNSLCREFLSLYPDRLLTLDILPHTVEYLQIFDRKHGTTFSAKARTLFMQFAEEITRADQNQDQVECLMLLNFRDVLGSNQP